MNLQHLRYLLAISRTGSFTAAASLMHVTQPTVSSGIAELESELGVRLFQRSGRLAEFTAEGQTLLNYATRISDLVEEVGDHLRKRDVVSGETFRFGAIDAAVVYLLPGILRRYLSDHPDVELSVQVAPSRYLAEDLLASRLEFAVITMPFDNPRLVTLSLHREQMILVAGASHPFAHRGRVTIEEVSREPLILFHEDSVSRRIVDEKFAEAAVAPRVVMAMRSPEAMRKLVEAGVGISFLPFMTVEDAIRSGALKRVAVKGVHFNREIGLAWKKGRYFGPAVSSLLNAIVDQFGKATGFKKARALPGAEGL